MFLPATGMAANMFCLKNNPEGAPPVFILRNLPYIMYPPAFENDYYACSWSIYDLKERIHSEIKRKQESRSGRFEAALAFALGEEFVTNGAFTSDSDRILARQYLTHAKVLALEYEPLLVKKIESAISRLSTYTDR
ncbi:hypothetical protein ACFL0K_01445 [Patescibacteria group bacterium]